MGPSWTGPKCWSWSEERKVGANRCFFPPFSSSPHRVPKVHLHPGTLVELYQHIFLFIYTWHTCAIVYRQMLDTNSISQMFGMHNASRRENINQLIIPQIIFIFLIDTSTKGKIAWTKYHLIVQTSILLTILTKKQQQQKTDIEEESFPIWVLSKGIFETIKIY